MSEVKSTMSCLPFTNDETAYNCAAYKMSPECYNKYIVTNSQDFIKGTHKKVRGLELGEENVNAQDNYYNCLVS